MGGPRYRYSQGFKWKVVQEIARGELTIGEAKTVYDISYPTVYRWLRQLGQEQVIGKVVHVQTRADREKLTRLEAEKRELEAAVARLQVEVMALESLLEEVQAQTGMDVKKNGGGPPSTGDAP